MCIRIKKCIYVGEAVRSFYPLIYFLSGLELKTDVIASVFCCLPDDVFTMERIERSLLQSQHFVQDSRRT